MKKILLTLLILLSACSTKSVKNDVDFSMEMTFNQFKTKLEEYAKINSYPNIDK